MKNFLYTFLILIVPARLMAQPTINNAYNYSTGTTVKNIRCVDMGAGNAGANQTWDFTSLTPVGNGKDTARYWYMSPASNAPVSGANLVEKSSDSTYVYIKASAAQDEILAIADSSAGNYNLTVTYTNSVLFFKRPLTYGMNFTDNSAEQYSVSSFNLQGSGNISFKVDGYGTLKLPNNQTYNDVLRVEIKQHQSDTVQFPAPSVAVMDVTRYLWFDANHRSPLLRIDAVDITSDLFTNSKSFAEYLYEEHASAVADVQKQNMELTGSFSGNTLYLNGSFDTKKDYIVQVYNLNGQKVYQSTFTGVGQQHIFTANSPLPQGLYLVSVTENGNNYNNTTIKVPKQ